MKCSWRKCRIQPDVGQDNIEGHSSIEDLRMSIVGGNVKSPAKKSKRFRSAFTTEQVTYLEKEFRKYPYIGNTRRKDVASVLSIPERAVKIWFQNRRMKEKKDVMMKEPADIKRAVIDEGRPYFYVSKLDQSSSSFSKPNLLQKIVEPNTELGVNVNQEAKIQVRENVHIKVSSPTLSSLPSQQIITQLKKDQPISEINKNNNEKLHTRYFLKTCNSPSRKKSPKLGFSPYSPILPQDLSSSKKQEENNFQEPKTMQELHLPMFTSGASTAGSPVIVGGYYPQAYMPPGNMMWKPITTSSTMPITTSRPGGPTISAGSQSLPKVNCTCDCHLQPSCGGPVVLQHGVSNPLMQYIITAVPISN